MRRSAWAIACGALLWYLVGFATGDAWGKYAGHESPDLVLLARVLAAVAAGYLAAFVGRRAEMGHALGVAALLVGWSVIVRFIELVQQTTELGWARWVVGAVSVAVWIVAGGLFRYWQATRRAVRLADQAEPVAPHEPPPSVAAGNSTVREGGGR
jgi:peptidoglycan/LPS O-acetylase OafA/YrhL